MAKGVLEPGLMSTPQLWRALYRRLIMLEPGTNTVEFATKCLLWREARQICRELEQRGTQGKLGL